MWFFIIQKNEDIKKRKGFVRGFIEKKRYSFLGDEKVQNPILADLKY